MFDNFLYNSKKKKKIMGDESRSTIPKGQTQRLIFYFFEQPLNALEERQAEAVGLV
jgi:hypothetical protein